MYDLDFFLEVEHIHGFLKLRFRPKIKQFGHCVQSRTFKVLGNKVLGWLLADKPYTEGPGTYTKEKSKALISSPRPHFVCACFTAPCHSHDRTGIFSTDFCGLRFRLLYVNRLDVLRVHV